MDALLQEKSKDKDNGNRNGNGNGNMLALVSEEFKKIQEELNRSK